MTKNATMSACRRRVAACGTRGDPCAGAVLRFAARLDSGGASGAVEGDAGSA
jgi:hypothetical protein